MNEEQLQEVLYKHELWLNGEGGEKAYLSGVNLSGANLRNTNLSGANLTGADLTDATLSYANLRGANLTGADLRGVDLRGADLRGADLSEVNLKNAKLNWTSTQNIQGVIVISIQFDTSRKNNKLSYWKDLEIYTTGCFQGSEEELRKSIEKKHGNYEVGLKYLNAIDYIKYLTN